jgi:hypothetical protein
MSEVRRAGEHPRNVDWGDWPTRECVSRKGATNGGEGMLIFANPTYGSLGIPRDAGCFKLFASLRICVR